MASDGMTDNAGVGLDVGPLLLVGGGKMGGALLDGWLAMGVPAGDVWVVDPSDDSRAAWAGKGVSTAAGVADLPGDLVPRVIVLAVKPQAMAKVLPHYTRFADGRSVFLSVAAGKTIAFFAETLGGEAPIVRTIPNTPAAVGKGVTVLTANDRVREADRKVCDTLLQAVGITDWVEDEALIDVVTAVSGSGPAYVFHMIEALTEAGRVAGLPEEMAARIARATVCGAGALAEQSPEEPGQLRRNVTSPGGTTQAALDVLMAEQGGLTQLMTRAVAAAARRSCELAE